MAERYGVGEGVFAWWDRLSVGERTMLLAQERIRIAEEEAAVAAIASAAGAARAKRLG